MWEIFGSGFVCSGIVAKTTWALGNRSCAFVEVGACAEGASPEELLSEVLLWSSDGEFGIDPNYGSEHGEEEAVDGEGGC